MCLEWVPPSNSTKLPRQRRLRRYNQYLEMTRKLNVKPKILKWKKQNGIKEEKPFQVPLNFHTYLVFFFFVFLSMFTLVITWIGEWMSSLQSYGYFCIDRQIPNAVKKNQFNIYNPLFSHNALYSYSSVCHFSISTSHLALHP